MSTTCYGWGVQQWGTAWGGYCVTVPDQLPTAGWGEAVQRWQEQREERNVIFRVSGLHARARLGEIEASGGRGLTAFTYPASLHAQLGAVGIGVAAAPRLTSQQLQVLLGRVTADDPVGAHVAAARGRVGKPTIRAVRNPTDEEFIQFLLDVL